MSTRSLVRLTVRPARRCPPVAPLVAALVFWAAGCAHAPSGPPAFRWTASVRPAAYFPLAVGTAWSYDALDPGTGRSVLVINSVKSSVDKLAVFSSVPDPLAYEDLGDRIVSRPSGKPVLITPIQKGTTWPLPAGGAATIVDIAAVADTKAGRYASCVTIEEIAPDRRIVTVFAPGVGPVKIEIYAREGAAELLVSSAVLRSYHAAGSESP